MDRRRFLSALLALPAAPAALALRAEPAPRTVLVQRSPVAGFQYHQGEAVWPALRPGAALDLVREPDNRHDRRAVAVYWRRHKLGYLPRVENTAVCQMLDRGERLAARIVGLRDSHDPWERVAVEVVLRV